MDLSDAYANAPHIANAASYPPRWAEAAQAFRSALGGRAQCAIPYGPAPREKFDLFLPEGTPRGLMVFIHGGYWKAFDRQDWSGFAAGGVARGWAVAMPGYTLAPEARIAAITRQMVAAVSAAAARVPGPLVVTGHSAGGHLSARMACTDVTLPVADRLGRVVPISPLSDLRPLLQTDLNETLGIDMDEALAESPALMTPRAGVSGHVWVGGGERPAFLDQAEWLGRAWNIPVTVDAGRHHFDVIDGLCDPDSPLTETILGGL